MLVVCLLASAGMLRAEDRRGQVLFLRHALAPGTGDPPGMRLDDCATQRNLSGEGRAQAREIGRLLRSGGLPAAAVFTSQWCRCRETAKLLGFGEPVILEALNSFFGNPARREGYLRDLQSFLDGRPADGPAVILVTHQVTVQAMTGHAPGSGGGWWMRRAAGGGWETAGEFKAP